MVGLLAQGIRGKSSPDSFGTCRGTLLSRVDFSGRCLSSLSVDLRELTSASLVTANGKIN